jgi:hypothetical protein
MKIAADVRLVGGWSDANIGRDRKP